MRSERSSLFFLLVPLSLLVLHGQSFELLDTIHALLEENIQLHEQLENITQALRELKRLLWHHSNDSGHHEPLRGQDVQHLWDEWSEHAGLSAETHLLLEHVFCGHELHSSAAPSRNEETTVLLLTSCCLALLLVSCWWDA